MNLIFHNGEKLYQEESKILNDCSDFFKNLQALNYIPTKRLY